MTDSVVRVYDGRAVHLFSTDGGFLGREEYLPGSASPFSVRAVHASPGGIVYAVETEGGRGEGRRLEVRAASGPDGDRRLFGIGLAAPPSEGGVTFYSRTQPAPLFAARGSCLYVSDGEHEWVARYDGVRKVSARQEAGPVRVYRVNPATGAAEEAKLPAFPVAFGEPGVFYARARSPVTDELYLARFDLTPEER